MSCTYNGGAYRSVRIIQSAHGYTRTIDIRLRNAVGLEPTLLYCPPGSASGGACAIQNPSWDVCSARLTTFPLVELSERRKFQDHARGLIRPEVDAVV